MNRLAAEAEMLYSEGQRLTTHKTGEALGAKDFGIGQAGMVP